MICSAGPRPSTLWLGGLLAFYFAAGPTGGASAQPAPPVRVYALSYATSAALSRDAKELEGLARAALADAPGFDWQAGDDVARGDVAAARAACLRAVATLRRGRDAYLNFDLDAAVQLLEEATAHFQQGAAALDDPQLPAEALMYLGASHVLLEDDAAADRVFRRYHVQFGALPPDGRVFNPQIMARWERAGERVQRQGVATLEVSAEGDAPWVSVDGQVRGVAPLRLEVAPGEHVVRVAADGVPPRVYPVRTRAGATTQVEAGVLEGAPGWGALRRQLPGEDGAPASQAARALAARLGVDQLLLLQVEPGLVDGALSLTLHLLDARDGLPIAQLRRDLGGPLAERAAAVRKLVASALDEALEARRVATLARSSRQPEPRPAEASAGSRKRRGRLWTWIGVLGGVAVVGGGVLAALLLADGAPVHPRPPADQAGVVIEF